MCFTQENAPGKNPKRCLHKSDLLSLAELGCAACAFETVFLSFFHSGVTGQEAGLLEDGAQLGIVLEQSAGQTMTESAGLSGNRRAAE